jgi:hypothetical protein
VGCHRGPRASTVVVLNDLQGVTEPCGCTSDPRGGLDHIAGFLQELRTAAGKPAVALAVNGSTFYTEDQANAAQQTQEHTKARAIAEFLQALRPVAINPGPLDRGSTRSRLEALFKEVHLPVLWGDSSQSTFTLGGVRIGILGVPPYGDLAFIALHAARMRAQGAQFVIALVSDSVALAAQTKPDSQPNRLQDLHGVNILVQGNTQSTAPPELVGTTLRVSAGRRGGALGVLQLQPQKDLRQWSFFDGGELQRQSLQARLKRLQSEVAALPAGDAKQARQAKLQQLRSDLEAVDPAPPAGSTFNFKLKVLDRKSPTASWARTLLATYNRSLCSTAAGAPPTACTPARTQNERFVGTAQCLTCHAATLPVYQASAHARAWATLTAVGKECDLGCVGCHSVGFNKAGGPCSLAALKPFENVGCESCHGAGSGHAQHPGDRTQWGRMSRTVSEAVCRSCHTPEHSDKFNYATYLPQILGPGHTSAAAHAVPLP